MELFPYTKKCISETTRFFVFFRLSTLGSIITKQGFGAILAGFSTKSFKFYLYLSITHCFRWQKLGIQPTTHLDRPLLSQDVNMSILLLLLNLIED